MGHHPQHAGNAPPAVIMVCGRSWHGRPEPPAANHPTDRPDRATRSPERARREHPGPGRRTHRTAVPARGLPLRSGSAPDPHPWCDGAVTTAPARQLVRLRPAELLERLDEALQVYVNAMGYPPSTVRHRRSLWTEHTRRAGWRAVAWLDTAGAIVGIAYGYTGGRGQWWHDEVRRGIAAQQGEPAWLEDYFELTELHVNPATQGHGLGEALLRSLLDDVSNANVLLSTPEHGERPPGRAWRLYRRTGFDDVLRAHRFTGDSRPFAVLGRALPLERPMAR